MSHPVFLGSIHACMHTSMLDIRICRSESSFQSRYCRNARLPNFGHDSILSRIPASVAESRAKAYCSPNRFDWSSQDDDDPEMLALLENGGDAAEGGVWCLLFGLSLSIPLMVVSLKDYIGTSVELEYGCFF